MLKYLRGHPGVRHLLVEKTDRLYRNLKDWVTLDEFEVEIHLVKEGVVISRDSRSSEKFMHGIKVLMAKNYVDNLSEEARKGMLEKAKQGIWPTAAPIGYLNVVGPSGKKIIVPDPSAAPIVTRLFEWFETGDYSIKDVYPARCTTEWQQRGAKSASVACVISIACTAWRMPLSMMASHCWSWAARLTIRLAYSRQTLKCGFESASFEQFLGRGVPDGRVQRTIWNA
jgi:hypothetical protein